MSSSGIVTRGASQGMSHAGRHTRGAARGTSHAGCQHAGHHTRDVARGTSHARLDAGRHMRDARNSTPRVDHRVLPCRTQPLRRGRLVAEYATKGWGIAAREHMHESGRRKIRESWPTARPGDIVRSRAPNSTQRRVASGLPAGCVRALTHGRWSSRLSVCHVTCVRLCLVCRVDSALGVCGARLRNRNLFKIYFVSVF